MMKRGFFERLLKKYSRDDFVEFNRARALAIICFMIIGTVTFYLAIMLTTGFYKDDVFGRLVIPLFNGILGLVGLLILIAGYRKTAGNFIMTFLVLFLLLSSFNNVLAGLNHDNIIAGDFFYILLIFSVGALFATRFFIIANYILIIASLFAINSLAIHNYPPEIVERIHLSSINFFITLTVLLLIILGVIKLFNKTLTLLVDARHKLEEKILYLNKILSQVGNIAVKLSNTSSNLLKISAEISDKAREQAAETEEIAATTEEITSTIEANTTSAATAKDLLEKAYSQITVSMNILEDTIDTFLKISENVKVISEIAEKTDLLAINAAIEAARAGENGKSFGVIAQEIRNLSDNSKEASENINSLIEVSREKALNTRHVFRELVTQSQENLQVLNQIISSNQEQLESISQINSSISQIASFASINTNVAEKVVNYAKELNKLADLLYQITNEKS